MTEIIDFWSSHNSPRRGRKIKYIVVHSTASAPDGNPYDTAKYLAGPNSPKVSVHELVLPGRKVYRMVRDELAAHHCESATVNLPGIDPVDANESTWGIELYQESNSVVPGDVINIGIERVAEACIRLGINVDNVVGHGEIDPSRRHDPVFPEGINMDWFREKVKAKTKDSIAINYKMLTLGIDSRCLFVNPSAALLKRIIEDGYIPTGNEQVYNAGAGKKYYYQLAEKVPTLSVRTYYVLENDWDNVEYAE